ncbi:MAG: bifunctional (p)ppGpp synthetase/guanosine-3',5'-bis(diphosphate) 3'-pyrophosphohydrolase [SAR202 cluster bacterium]|nr:bifunctional (p)ppGpp synthetase/guanosine-3',5'-bis(diphosphate) 3'-pyrophosphohydrolase [SAR202 cluster bacterium]
MDSIQLLIDKAEKYLIEDQVSVIQEAYKFALESHKGQSRLSGEPYINHPIETANFLADLKLDHQVLAAALLHDVMEDCNVAFDKLSQLFGEDIAKLVDGVTKLTRSELTPEMKKVQANGNNELSDEDILQAENLRKLISSIAVDVRIILIKLSDRLHNMNTLNSLPYDRQLYIARETLDIYAPLAHRLGIWELKWRLEDLSFQYLNPKEYQNISLLLKTKRSEREKYIENIIDILQPELDSFKIKSQISGRPKNIYSIYKKIQSYLDQNKKIEEIYDFFALRILVTNIDECYSALGLVHKLWRPIPGQFDDYIANPKDNLYQSLHTTVLCEGAHPVEVQIRTKDMHSTSEYGVAAHWLYKSDSDLEDDKFDSKITWLRQIFEWQKDVVGAQEFVESFKSDVFKNQVFVYTPKSDLKELPAGSTPLDFAYRIHTDIGHRCVGAKVNDKLVPLSYQLKNGDRVEIITSKTVRGPSLDWLNNDLGFLQTTSAKTRVKQWFNRQEHKNNLQNGKYLFEERIKHFNNLIEISDIVKLMNFDNESEFLNLLGSGKLPVSEVIEELAKTNKISSEKGKLVQNSYRERVVNRAVTGSGDLKTVIALCCSPSPETEIVGFLNRDQGVSVHRRNCKEIIDYDLDNQIEVDWNNVTHDYNSQTYPSRIKIDAYDRVGLLRDITVQVAKERLNIASCIQEEYNDISIIYLTVYINSIENLDHLCSSLDNVKGVISVSRTVD